MIFKLLKCLDVYVVDRWQNVSIMVFIAFFKHSKPGSLVKRKEEELESKTSHNDMIGVRQSR